MALAKCQPPEPPPPPPCPSDADRNRFGFSGEQTATFAQNGPLATLSPNIHWSYDTRPAANVIPVAPSHGSQMYYGIGVNLDHCDHVASIDYRTEVLTVKFNSEEAYWNAIDTWTSKDGLILIAFAKGCGDYSKGERCYFQVSDLDFGSPGLVITAIGRSSHPDDVITSGETEWGSVPSDGSSSGSGGAAGAPGGPPQPENGASPSIPAAPPSLESPGLAPNQPGSPNPAATPGANAAQPNVAAPPGGPAADAAAAAAAAAAASSTPSPMPADVSASGLNNVRACVGPPDTRFGLLTACAGEFFDEDLDDGLGYAALSPENRQFVLDLAPDFLEESIPGEFGMDLDPNDPFFKKRQQRHRKRIWGALRRAFNKHIVQPIKRGYQAVQQALSIGGSINKDFSWKVPNPQSSNPDDKKLRDPGAKQAVSPWGDAILLKTFTSQGQNTNGFMNIYCVGCGVSGNAKIAGRARWTPLGGFLEGQVDVRTDIKFVLKLGIDAEITYSREFTSDLINVGLPGLSYGVVTIGPRISVGTRVGIQAAAKGRLLAGAEMGLQDAHVLIDFVNSGRSTKSGWEPYFKPVFEAQGELMLSASLGLPIGIKCGIQISTWDKSVGVVDEPSIKGVAQVAASIGLAGSTFVGGFTETNGCTGIATQISWRNRLYIDILGIKQIPLLDTNDRPLARGSPPPPPALPASETNQNTPPTEPNPEPNAQPPASEPAPAPATPNPESNPPPPAAEPAPGTPAEGTPPERRSLDPRQAGNGVTEVPVSNSGPTDLSYSSGSVGNDPYFDSAGREFAMLIDPTGSTMVISCSNGNMYPVRSDSPDNDFCSELWASVEDVLIYDGAQRLMHYYSNTMSKLGVSRVRVEAELDAPVGSVLVAWAPYYDPPGSNEYFYVAIDPADEIYYPIACDYSDGTASKIFLALDPVEGVKTLMSDDVIYSVTGGKVSSCQPLVLNQGTRQA
nr:uncharacterized protein CTRU02_03609 [Colletotrichum truncatum]KAF6796631.1 hypothetical protein CTRU02_03609 [Colletotrichum truncatum]